jgi:hypothetical protein
MPVPLTLAWRAREAQEVHDRLHASCPRHAEDPATFS